MRPKYHRILLFTCNPYPTNVGNGAKFYQLFPCERRFTEQRRSALLLGLPCFLQSASLESEKCCPPGVGWGDVLGLQLV